LPNGKKNLPGNTDTALAPCVVTVTIKTRARGEMLRSRNQLLNTLGWGLVKIYMADTTLILAVG
jgi:hypothetical protein